MYTPVSNTYEHPNPLINQGVIDTSSSFSSLLSEGDSSPLLISVLSSILVSSVSSLSEFNSELLNHSLTI